MYFNYYFYIFFTCILNSTICDTKILHFYRDLDMKKPFYQKTACYGHFGRPEFTWEQPKMLVFEK